jgi:16S rRNA (uracil1498-N3)-methyltransferase
MSDPRFFIERLSTDTLELPASEVQHAIKSRRLSVGSRVVLTDGRGAEAPATIVRASRDQLEIQVESVHHRPRPKPELTLAVALPKGPRQDILVEKSTELGVARIQPIQCMRSIAAAGEHRLDKWQRKGVEAVKQSGQCWIPEFKRLTPLNDVLADLSRYDRAFVTTTEPTVDRQPKTGLELITTLATLSTLCVFVGPEGGWSPEELLAFTDVGVEPISLGPNILRIETAATSVAAIVHAIARG